MEDRTKDSRRGGSERRSVERREDKDQSITAGTISLSGMKVHKGPLNLATVSMKNPVEIMKNLLATIEEQGIRTTVTSKYSVKCEKNGIKFSSELNMVENLDNLFTIKFYKSSGDSIKYANLCNAIFTKLAL